MRRTLFTMAVAVGLALCTQAFGQKTGDVSQSNRISAGTVTLKKGERFRRTASGGVTVVDIATGKTNITVECICDPDTKGGDGSGKCEAQIRDETVGCAPTNCADCDMRTTDVKGDDKVQVESPGGQGGTPVYRPESGGAGSEGRKWTITPNRQLKGSTGRIAVDVPDEKASVIFLILRPGEASHIDGWYGSKAGNFLPGTYDIKVFDARITGVPVERGKDTRVHVGVLSVPFDSIYEIYDETRTNRVFSGIGSEKKKIVLPVGSYYVRAAGGEQLVVIKDGEVTDF